MAFFRRFQERKRGILYGIFILATVAVVFAGAWTCRGAFFLESSDVKPAREMVRITSISDNPEVSANDSGPVTESFDASSEPSAGGPTEEITLSSDPGVSSGVWDTEKSREAEAAILPDSAESPTDRLNLYPGRVVAFKKSILTFRVSGPLLEIDVVPGQVVKKGDRLMQIDPRDYQIQVDLAQSRLDVAYANLEAMRAGARPEDIALLRAKVDEAKASRDLADKEFQRYKELVDKKAVSVSEYDAANRTFVLAGLACNSAEKELEKGLSGARAEEIKAAEAEIRGLEASLTAAKNSLDDTTLRAPYDGVITTKMIEEYEMVTTTPTYRSVLGIHDISRLKIEVYIPEREMVGGQWSPGRVVKVRFTARRENLYDANLYEIDTEPSEVGMTYKLTFVLNRPDDLPVLPGMISEVFLPETSRQ